VTRVRAQELKFQRQLLYMSINVVNIAGI